MDTPETRATRDRQRRNLAMLAAVIGSAEAVGASVRETVARSRRLAGESRRIRAEAQAARAGRAL